MPALNQPAFRFPALHPKDINRLITSLNPKGTVIYQNDFERDIVGMAVQPTDGSYGKTTCGKAHSGVQSLYLRTKSASGAAVEAKARIPHNLNWTLSFENFFSLPNDDLDLFFGIEQSSLTMAYAMVVGIKSRSTGTSIELASGTVGAEFAWITIKTYTSRFFYGAWDYLKLTGNFQTKKYKQIILDDEVIDLSNYELGYGTKIKGGRNGYFYYWLKNPEAVSRQCWLDDLIIAKDE